MVGVRPSLRGTSPAFWFLKIVVALIAQLLDLLFKFLDLFSPVWICWCHLDVVCLSLLCVAFIELMHKMMHLASKAASLIVFASSIVVFWL